MQFEVDPMHVSQENGQKPHFWPFGSFKRHFCNFWMIQHGRYERPLVKIIIYCNWNMQFEADPMYVTQEDGQKLHFRLFGSFKRRFFVNFEWYRMGASVANSGAPSSSMKICNIESNRCPKREILAEIHMDHSKGPKRIDEWQLKKKNQIISGHSVFAMIFPGPCSFI